MEKEDLMREIQDSIEEVVKQKDVLQVKRLSRYDPAKVAKLLRRRGYGTMLR